MGDTDSLDMCGQLHCVRKRKEEKKIVPFGTPPSFQGSILGQSGTELKDDPHIQSETPPCFKGPRGDDPERLFVFKALRRSDPALDTGTIHNSNPEHLDLFYGSTQGQSTSQGGGLTNESPGTDNVISGSMRGLTINYMGRGHT